MFLQSPDVKKGKQREFIQRRYSFTEKDFETEKVSPKIMILLNLFRKEEISHDEECKTPSRENL